MLARCGGIVTLILYWWECKLAQPLWKATWQYLLNLNIGLLYHPAVPLSENENLCEPKDVQKHSFVPLFTMFPSWKQPKCPLGV